MSLFVTGELTRNFANRKLKISDVEPSGATYSGEDSEPISCHVVYVRGLLTCTHILQSECAAY